jgi:hypothetical protein
MTPYQTFYDLFLNKIVEDAEFFQYNNVPANEAQALAMVKCDIYLQEAFTELTSRCKPDVDFDNRNDTEKVLNIDTTHKENELIAYLMYEKYFEKDMTKLKKLQQYLGITADGIFGTKTKQAVIDFQRKNGLSADGIVGKNTHNVLGFDTGGYTGDSQGLALLHKKELVLNGEDTKNILDVVKMTRDMISSFSPMFETPRLSIPQFSIPNLSNSTPNIIQYVYNAPLVNQEVDMVNNTPFDIQNNQDNWERAIKSGLFKSGYGMPKML